MDFNLDFIPTETALERITRVARVIRCTSDRDYARSLAAEAIPAARAAIARWRDSHWPMTHWCQTRGPICLRLTPYDVYGVEILAASPWDAAYRHVVGMRPRVHTIVTRVTMVDKNTRDEHVIRIPAVSGVVHTQRDGIPLDMGPEVLRDMGF